jgi:hypothetical protein
MKIVKFIKDKALSASIAAYQLRGTVAKSLVVFAAGIAEQRGCS